MLSASSALSRSRRHFFAWQNTHTPFEVPARYLNASIASRKDKRTYLGMGSCMDAGVGAITDALVARGYWNDTLVVFSADNGGEHTSAGNNFPLRGGKYTDFEGGTRNIAFASGGWLAPELRGTSTAEWLHVCDIWATFAALAGTDPTDHRAAAAGLPPLDGLDMWPMLSGANETSPRTEVVFTPLSGDRFNGTNAHSGDAAILIGRHKLMYRRRDSNSGHPLTSDS